jgi:hypothetical protein
MSIRSDKAAFVSCVQVMSAPQLHNAFNPDNAGAKFLLLARANVLDLPSPYYPFFETRSYANIGSGF